MKKRNILATALTLSVLSVNIYNESAKAQEITTSDFGAFYEAVKSADTDIINISGNMTAVTPSESDQKQTAASLVINGQNNTITAGDDFRFLNGFLNPNGNELTVNDLTVSGLEGKVWSSGENKNGYTILNSSGTLTLNNVTIENSKYANLSSTKTLNITDSSFKNNEYNLNNATTNHGGALNLGGTAIITDTVFEGNKASGNGGAIYNSRAKLTINGGSFIGNESSKVLAEGTTPSRSNFAGGGALVTSNTTNIEGTLFQSNKAAGDGGAIIIVQTTTATTINKGNFILNEATGTDSAGGAIALLVGTLNLIDTDFTSNKAAYGGAIYEYLKSPSSIYKVKLNVTNGNFESNTALAAGAIGIFNEAEINGTVFKKNESTSTETGDGGGALFLGSESKTTINSAKFYENKAALNGGAIALRDIAKNNSAAVLDITGSTFEANEAAQNGGAIYNTFYNSATDELKGYVAVTGNTFNGNKAGVSGGAIYNEAADSTGALSSIYLASNEFTGNTAATHGGAIYNNGNLAFGSGNTFSLNEAVAGGAIYNNSTEKVTITGTFSANKASGGTGKNPGGGGAINNSSSAGELIIAKGSLFEENEASNSWGGAIYNASTNTLTINEAEFNKNKAKYNGGAIAASTKSGDLLVINSTFSENQQTYSSSSTSAGGGAISSLGENTTILGSTFSRNESKMYGGALLVQGNTTLLIDKYDNPDDTSVNTSFSNNKASRNGGALSVTKTENIIISNTDFDTNQNTGSSYSGGAIYAEASANLYLDTVTLNNNTASVDGGGMYFKATDDNCIVNIFDTSVTNNKINPDSSNKKSGGGIYIEAGKETNIAGINDTSVFSGNNAAKNGGGLYYTSSVENAVLNISNVKFESNTSGDTAGGAFISQESGTVNITDSMFKGNEALDGGGLFLQKGATFNIKSSEFSLNNAILSSSQPESSGNGGALNISESSIVNISDDSSFSQNTAERGGAIYQQNTAGKLVIDTIKFNTNEAVTEGGALWLGKEAEIKGAEFTGNKTTGTTVGSSYEDTDNGGGAIFVGGVSNTSIADSIFTSNTSGTYGGAISTRIDASSDTASLTVNNSTFSLNTAELDGGAIAAYVNTTVTDSSFKNNTAGNNGGAIYNAADVKTVIIADTKDIEFTGNTANGSSNAIYNDGGELTLTANADKNIILNDAAAGSGTLIKNGEGTLQLNTSMNDYTGNIQIDAGIIKLGEDGTYFENASATVANGGMLDLRNTKTQAVNLGNLTLNSNLNAAVDFNLLTEEIDNFTADSLTGTGKISIADINVELLQDADKLKVEAKVANDILKDNINFATNTSVQTGDSTDFTGNSSFPWYITYETKDDGGYLIFDRADVTLKKAVNAVDSERVYAMGRDEYVLEDLGDLNGGKLVVSGNNKDIIASGQSGIITTDSSQVLSFNNINNITGFNSENGSFIDNTAGADVNFLNVNASGNTSSSDGGFIKNNGNLVIENAVLSQNNASNGGAIYNSTNASLIDTDLINNTSSSNGGAVYNAANATLNIIAENKNVSLSGNIANGESNVVYNEGTLNINSGSTITLGDKISGNGILNINGALNYIDAEGNQQTASSDGLIVINNDMSGYTGDVVYNGGTVKVASGGVIFNSENTTINGGSFDLMNNQLDTSNLGNLTLNSTSDVNIDFDLSQIKSDSFNAIISGSGKLNVDKINVYGNTLENYIRVHLSDLTGIDENYLSSTNQTLPTVLTPIRYLAGSVSDNYLTYQPTGERYKDFNPAVMAAPIAAQMGGYLTILNSYEEAFRNMDMYMLMTKSQREALKYANKYAAADANLIFSPTATPYDNEAGWFRPYAVFESVGLKNGPKVNNVAYGSFAGLESEMYELGNGWDGMISLYAGYNGSHQTYQGNSIYQNGGTLGLVGMAYKGNFFTGLTANIGANVADANTMYGSEDFAMLMTGVASKSGYNYEFADGKFIVQPNFIMSYSMVNTFDYTNAAGVRIDSDPLHAIQLEPGFKFIGNLNNGWQPYAGVSVVWNIMDKTEFKANDVSLPSLSVKPFVKYGLGVRKTWGERFTGFLQAFLTNGGRNGIGLQAGFRWKLGKDESNSQTNEPSVKKYIKAGSKQNIMS